MLNLLISLMLILAFAVAPITQAQEEEELTQKVAQVLEELTQQLAQMQAAHAQVKKELKETQKEILAINQMELKEAQEELLQAQAQLQKVRKKFGEDLDCIVQERVGDARYLVHNKKRNVQERIEELQELTHASEEVKEAQKAMLAFEQTELMQAQEKLQHVEARLQEADLEVACNLIKEAQRLEDHWENILTLHRVAARSRLIAKEELALKELEQTEVLTETLTEVLAELADALR